MNDEEQLRRDLQAIASWGDPEGLPSIDELGDGKWSRWTSRRGLVAAVLLAVAGLGAGIAALIVADGGGDDGHIAATDSTDAPPSSAASASTHPVAPSCSSIEAWFEAMENVAITYDYLASGSAQALAESGDAVVSGHLSAVRPEWVPGDALGSYLVFTMAVDEVYANRSGVDIGTEVEFSLSYGPASRLFEAHTADFQPGTPALLFLDSGLWPGGWGAMLEGFWVACDAEAVAIPIHVAPLHWEHLGTLDELASRAVPTSGTADAAAPTLEPGVVDAGEPVEFTHAQATMSDFLLAELSDDGVFVTRWGLISDGDDSGGPRVVTDLSEFEPPGVEVPANTAQQIPTPPEADAGAYILCPGSDPDLPCTLLGIGDVSAEDMARCGAPCEGRTPGDALELDQFQSAVALETSSDTITITTGGRPRLDTFIVETRNSDEHDWWPTYSLTSLGGPATTSSPINSLDFIEPRIVDNASQALRFNEWVPRRSDVQARICPFDKMTMPCTVLEPSDFDGGASDLIVEVEPLDLERDRAPGANDPRVPGSCVRVTLRDRSVHEGCVFATWTHRWDVGDEDLLISHCCVTTSDGTELKPRAGGVIVEAWADYTEPLSELCWRPELVAAIEATLGPGSPPYQLAGCTVDYAQVGVAHRDYPERAHSLMFGRSDGVWSHIATIDYTIADKAERCAGLPTEAPGPAGISASELCFMSG